MVPRDVLARYTVLTINENFIENVKFLYNTPNLSLFEKYFFVMTAPLLKWIIHPMTSKNLIKINKDPNQPEQKLHQELLHFRQSFKKDAIFYSNQINQPSIVDTDVYGVLWGIRLHPMYERIRNSNKDLKNWMDQMEKFMK